MAQHKWHKEIKAWADGAEIEYRLPTGRWVTCDATEEPPQWLINIEYRIKPREYTYYTKVKIFPKTQGMVNTEISDMASFHCVGDNLKLTFDNRGTLIRVELIGDNYEGE